MRKILLLLAFPTLLAAQPDTRWFSDAKFGMFIHWGLYSQAGSNWQGKPYYGISEWMMQRGRIPVAEYEKLAATFNPTAFNAKEWAQVAKDAGMKYMVVTAKHHEGFAMYDSHVSPYNIVRATPYGKDPMKELSKATRDAGIAFGFYYSQFLDWHEPNGGGNQWDFDESKKDYLSYYRAKSIPQIRELLNQYGPLGLVWFDMPGGLSKEETQGLIDEVRRIQPNCLISSRVGNGLGDFKDYGDGEVPAIPVRNQPWEALFTHNDSWGYSRFDDNFKTPEEVIRLLATVASKGGNLILNVGPDGTGKMPEHSVRYLKEVGRWLSKNGESIYGTTAGLVPPQPWGVTTSKPGKLFLHVFQPPTDGKLLLPSFPVQLTGARLLAEGTRLRYVKEGADWQLTVPPTPGVIEVGYTGTPEAASLPLTVSGNYPVTVLEASSAKTAGKAAVSTVTWSHYFGDWKHAVCLGAWAAPEDAAEFSLRVTHPGEYKLYLEYANREPGQEGIVTFGEQTYPFLTLKTTDTYDSYQPLLFLRQPIAIVTVSAPGNYLLRIAPKRSGKELLKLKTVQLEPVR
ncbi:MAG: alpha-L-fucosidase [Siphonobacter aquaeclarae]|nr:alpha-L-fucosidase [Siphonobacter aquaeclarae]